MENLNDLYQWLIEQGVLIFERTSFPLPKIIVMH